MDDINDIKSLKETAALMEIEKIITHYKRDLITSGEAISAIIKKTQGIGNQEQE